MSRYGYALQPAGVEELNASASTVPLRAKSLISIDPASRALLMVLDRVAPSDAAIQVTGETGTGKELIARYIHRQSRRFGPFLAVNCGAISEHLAESELFGHEAGSFTGASSRREGWFEAANGGTLFLDEIGDMPLALQGKLLRTLQESEVTRIGARKPTKVDVRIVSATNVNLEAAVEAGRFRRDLFYRLNIVTVALPPLRERPGDIVALAEHFAAVYSAKLKRPTPVFDTQALVKLASHGWPGNVRELENVVHCSLLMAAGTTILPGDIRFGAAIQKAVTPPVATSVGSLGANQGLLPEACPMQAVHRLGDAFWECFKSPGANLLREVEGRLVANAFTYCHSNQVRTAELLGVSRNVVRTLLKRYALIAENVDMEGLCSRHRIESRCSEHSSWAC